MKSIILTRHPESMEIEARAAVCVYHHQYARILPKVENCESVEFGWLCEHFQDRNVFEGRDTVVFVGVNKFFTPSTRFHPVFEILQYGLLGLRRYSVDIAPYIGPLWRLWAHWSFAGVEFGGYTYSYLLESHYNAWLEGVRADNPLSLDKIRQYAAGHVQVDYERFFAEPRVIMVSMPPSAHAEYQRLKAELFNKHDTIAPIIRGLAQFAQAAYPQRRIPQEHRIFEAPDDVSIVRTDLKIDEYLTKRLLEKIAEVNSVVEALRG